MQAFRLACTDLGLILHEDKTTYNHYYGTGNCDMMVEVPGVKHQIGMIKEKDGSYRMECDTYGGLGNKIGSKGERLTDVFAAQKIQINGRNRGWAIQKQDTKNKKKIRLVLTKF